jgi:hypothetical protein
MLHVASTASHLLLLLLQRTLASSLRLKTRKEKVKTVKVSPVVTVGWKGKQAKTSPQLWLLQFPVGGARMLFPFLCQGSGEADVGLYCCAVSGSTA